MTADELDRLCIAYDELTRRDRAGYDPFVLVEIMNAIPQLIAAARDGLKYREALELRKWAVETLERDSDAARAATEGDEHGE